MELVVSRDNMMAAYRRVMTNKGSAGVDDMPVGALMEHLRENWAAIKEDLLNGRDEPSPVLKVEIPKPGGKGMRLPGIPTVVDRLVQQALHQVPIPIFDPDFSNSSYGFRPDRPVSQGWIAYFRLAETKGVFEDLDGWFRRKLRAILWRQWKRPWTRKRKLMQRGIGEARAWKSAGNGRGPWWNAGASHINQACPTSDFRNLGLAPIIETLNRLKCTS